MHCRKFDGIVEFNRHQGWQLIDKSHDFERVISLRVPVASISKRMAKRKFKIKATTNAQNDDDGDTYTWYTQTHTYNAHQIRIEENQFTKISHQA